MINKVILLGRIGKEPEIKDLSTGKVANLSIATSTSWKDKDGNKKENTEWHNVYSFNDKHVDLIKNYFKKGSPIYIEGKLTTQKYQKDGKDVYSTKIQIEKISFVPQAKQNSSDNNSVEEDDMPEDDIPF
jgi:single-strand DNA-binding protein